MRSGMVKNRIANFKLKIENCKLEYEGILRSPSQHSGRVQRAILLLALSICNLQFAICNLFSPVPS
jgi:hypothetical protein